MKYLFKIFITCLIILITGSSYGFEIERRREMFTKQYGHLFVPLPYSLPGLGEGLLFIGNFGNIADTTTDFATIFGVILGILFSFYIENIQIFFSNFFNLSLFPEEIYFLSQMPSKIDFNLIILIAFCSIIVTSVASLFPSIKAANLDPIKALKYE